MRRSRSITLAIAVLLVPLLASAQAQQPFGGFDPKDMPPKRVVSESEMNRYLKAIDRLVELGDESGFKGDPSKAGELRYNDAMRSAVYANGFDEKSFTDVHWNVMMGYMAAEMQARQPEVDAAKKRQMAEMEKMRAHMSPQQYEQMMKGMSQMLGVTGMWDDAPPENVALVKKHKAELDRILKNEKGARKR
jgi:hypothetical protein